MPKSQIIKLRINNMDYIKLRSFCTTMETNRVKMQQIEWKKIFSKHSLVKAIISHE